MQKYCKPMGEMEHSWQTERAADLIERDPFYRTLIERTSSVFEDGYIPGMAIVSLDEPSVRAELGLDDYCEDSFSPDGVNKDDEGGWISGWRQ